jgi:hypothetical protein
LGKEISIDMGTEWGYTGTVKKKKTGMRAYVELKLRVSVGVKERLDRFAEETGGNYASIVRGWIVEKLGMEPGEDDVQHPRKRPEPLPV